MQNAPNADLTLGLASNYFYIHYTFVPLVMKVPKTFAGVFLMTLFLVVIASCTKKRARSLRPERLESENVLTVEKGNLKAIFVDNTAISPDHRPGYNGIAQLYHTQEDSGIFVPDYAGFNLEHVFGGDSLEQLFEPRQHPMTLYRKTDDEVLLYQEPTPLSGVESLTSFKVVEPYYIDVTFECTLHNPDFFKHGYAGLFWASYINKPEDKKIYFRGTSDRNSDSTTWVAAWSHQHGVASTHKGLDDEHDFYFEQDFNARLASHFSSHRFSEPFFFGRYKNMVLAYFFDAKEVIRFSQSPTGGGEHNPAWDFQYLIPSPKVGKKYSFKARMLYKPFVSNEDIEKEFRKWKR